MRYGYARVSSKSQDYAGQVAALEAAGCERIFSEKVSGKSTDGRRELEKLKRGLLPGDTIVVTKLDRLARSSRDLHNILHDLAERECATWLYAFVYVGSVTLKLGQPWHRQVRK